MPAASVAVYSTTKFLGGHGVHIGGAIVDSGNFQWAENPKKWPEFTEPSDSYHGIVFAEALKPLGNLAYIIHIRTHWLRDTGGTQSPFAAFLLLLGIETLHLRLERHTQNAQAVAEWLLQHPAVTWVNYPGLPNHSHYQNAKKYLPKGAGAILGFGVRGGKEAGRIPSSRARRRAVSTASSLVIVSTRSTTDRSRVSGIMPAPMPCVSTRLAPKAFSTLRRSSDMVSGMVNVIGYPRDAATNASAIPVFPLIQIGLDVLDIFDPYRKWRGGNGDSQIPLDSFSVTL